MTTTKKWNEDSTKALQEFVGPVTDAAVSVEVQEQAAEHMGVTTRSIGAKLRKLGYTVESTAKSKTSAFSEEMTQALVTFVNLNEGAFTYAEIAEQFENGAFTSKQIQGKILALELTSKVKPAEKVEVATAYSPEQEAEFVALANSGKFIEDLAAHFGKTLASVRGKALSLLTKGLIEKIPAQKESLAKDSVDPLDELGHSINTMTVADIAAKTGKTERGIKSALTRRGIKVADYDGEAKRIKAQGKAEAA